MATITMPNLGENVTEGTIGRWLKQPGEAVTQDEPLVEVTTDKVNTEVAAPFAGVLATIVAEGTTIAVGGSIGTITTADEPASTTPAEQPVPDPAPVTNQAGGEASSPEPASTPAAPAATTAPAPASVATATVPTTATTATAPGERRRFTPVVVRLAEQHGIGERELHTVAGTGLGGRVNKQDLLAYIDQQGKTPQEQTQTTPDAPAPAASTPAAQPAPPVSAPRAPQAAAPIPAAGTTLPLTPMRRAIGEHMVRSLATAPHAWTMIEIDLTPLVRYRNAQKASFQEREGFNLSYVPFIVAATVAALQEYPVLNASLTEAGIVQHRALNIGLAVALPNQQGLIVPVIKGADGLSLVGLARAVQDLASRARANRLTADDLRDGTFTVNNPGTYGSVLSQPIINQPQAAILTMEAIVKRPVVLTDPTTGDDTIAIRSLMNMCLSFDHRILDGQTAGLFLNSIRQRLEQVDSSTKI